MIPIDCKINNFSFFVSLFLDKRLAIQLVENHLASTLCIHSFSAHYAAENSTKSIPTINPAITKSIQNVRSLKRASFINFKVGVLLGHGFVSLLVVLDSIPSKE